MTRWAAATLTTGSWPPLWHTPCSSWPPALQWSSACRWLRMPHAHRPSCLLLAGQVRQVLAVFSCPLPTAVCKYRACVLAACCAGCAECCLTAQHSTRHQAPTACQDHLHACVRNVRSPVLQCSQGTVPQPGSFQASGGHAGRCRGRPWQPLRSASAWRLQQRLVHALCGSPADGRLSGTCYLQWSGGAHPQPGSIHAVRACLVPPLSFAEASVWPCPPPTKQCQSSETFEKADAGTLQVLRGHHHPGHSCRMLLMSSATSSHTAWGSEFCRLCEI